MQIGRAFSFLRERVSPTRTLACAFAIAGCGAAAHADGVSLDSLKDTTLPNLTTAGVTIYGTLDVGYGYNSHGLPISGTTYWGGFWTIFGSKFANKSFSGLTDNALEQSKLGIKIEETIAPGWTAIGKAETGFDPMFGEIADACQTLARNNGRTTTPFVDQASTSGDGSRCGQAFNGPLYAGVSNATYGTLTFGRQQSLELDAIANYDPMNLSYAFSLLGYSGTVAGGFGDTEPARWDNSVKYVYQFGPVHAAAMYMDGGPDTAIFNGAWGANAGFTYQGLSVDAVYTRERGVVSASSLNFGIAGLAGTCNPNLYAGTATSPQTGNNCNTNTLNGTITDDEGWSVMAKYTFEFVDCCAGLKDTAAAGPKLTIYGGVFEAQLTNPQDPVQPNQTTIGGYFLGDVNNMPFGTHSAKDINTEWAGARLEWDTNWAFAIAWYRYAQDAFLNGANATCAAVTAENARNKNAIIAGTTSPVFIGNPVGSNCAGSFNEASFLVDYTFNKNFDVYAGVTWSEGEGGVISSYLQDNIVSFASGIRLRF
jgi:predicted porin